ncbi:glycosyltransferase family 2 protein [Oryzomonas rubra]|uniref:Glycosyltransferase family 2 protein n=2 Tax=Oryzomonas rubra TaxID=2509454 RepID=A0A5A9XHB2_9BACT|nr:glycosyltransferase family 2 protein [Oryzomonas rubra]
MVPIMAVDIAFIAVNYNTRALVEELIRFFATCELPFRHCLVVVDNSSTDGSREMLEQAQGDGLVYIQANENLGYGRGMNRGMAAVASRYACVMNTDLILNREALVALWEFFESRPEAGVASPVILGSDGRMQGFLSFPGLLLLYAPTLSKIKSKLWKLRVAKARVPLRVPGVLGAFFMIRRSCFAAPLFDEDFFFYYEDTELAHRYWEQGVPCYVLPQVSIIHTGGQSTSAAGGKLFQQSRRIYIEKCYGAPHTAWLATLDRARLRMKYYKYRILSCFVKSGKIQRKYEYYARLVQPDD